MKSDRAQTSCRSEAPRSNTIVTLLVITLKTGSQLLSDVTILVALKDRAHETKSFMRYSIIPEARYLFLDGSVDGSNESILKAHSYQNVEYIRFAPDIDMAAYVKKMVRGLRLIRTPYVMMADNDDVVLEAGLVAAMSVLNDDSGSVFAGGDVAEFRRSRRNATRVSWPRSAVSCRHLNGKQGLGAINASRLNWSHLWYSVFRTEVLEWCWNQVLTSTIQDPYLIEFLICDLAFSKGCYSHTHVTQYLKLQNQSDRSLAAHGFNFVEFGRQPKSWWAQSDQGDEILAAHLGVRVEEMESQFYRAAMIAGLRSGSLKPQALIREIGRKCIDRAPLLPLGLVLGVARGFRPTRLL